MQTLLQQLAKYQWSDETLHIWANSDFKCVYCDLYMLTSLDTFQQGVIDHILPRSRYPHMTESASNKALACWVCNRIKRHWDPNTRKSPVVFETGNILTSEQRDELIRRARGYVERMRLKKSDDWMETERAIADYRCRKKGSDNVG